MMSSIQDRLKSKNPYSVTRGIVACIGANYTDSYVVDELKRIAESDKRVVAGLCVSDLAVVALHLTGTVEYTGDDATILDLIKAGSQQPWIQECTRQVLES